MKQLLVTGGDGLLGSNLVRELLDRSYTVRVLVQPGRQVQTLEGLDIETVEGDILDISSLEKAVEGCEAIIHVAALTNVWPSRGDIYYTVNVEGTKNMVDVALKKEFSDLSMLGVRVLFSMAAKISQVQKKGYVKKVPMDWTTSIPRLQANK